MCGIFSVIKKDDCLFEEDEFASYYTGATGNWSRIPKSTSQEDTFLKSLLIATSLRGIDATGFALFDHEHKTIGIRKLPCNAIDFLKYTEYTDVENHFNTSKSGIIGHCRATTIGGNSYRTAHPFYFGDITGVHNGTLTTWTSLATGAISDSEAIYKKLASVTPEEYPEVLGGLFGAFALIWYNKATNKIYFARNKERPLAFIKGDNFVALASELSMLDFAFSRAMDSIKDKAELLEKCEMIESLEPNKLYTLDPETLGITITKLEYKTFPIASYTEKNYNKKSKSDDSYIKRYMLQKELEQSTPFSAGDTVVLNPTGYKQYGSNSEYGSIYGYISEGDKAYYFRMASVRNPKEVMSRYVEKFPEEIPTLTGTINSIYSDTSTDGPMRDLFTNIQVFPELLDNDKLIVHGINLTTVEWLNETKVC
jgi:glucosamine 6-phosphate synthetase-like amidotransferase/phosphosugar isomerase protein